MKDAKPIGDGLAVVEFVFLDQFTLVQIRDHLRIDRKRDDDDAFLLSLVVTGNAGCIWCTSIHDGELQAYIPKRTNAFALMDSNFLKVSWGRSQPSQLQASLQNLKTPLPRLASQPSQPSQLGLRLPQKQRMALCMRADVPCFGERLGIGLAGWLSWLVSLRRFTPKPILLPT